MESVYGGERVTEGQVLSAGLRRDLLIGTRKCEGSLQHGRAGTDRLSVSAALRSLGTRRDSAACLDSQIGEAVKEKSFQTPPSIQMPPFKGSCRQ